MSIPAPGTDETATPVYGIRKPNSLQKAKWIGRAIGRIADDVEAALGIFGLPPVVSTSSVVASSSAARDAHWGTPASAAARRALQDLGATTIRTDLGYSERYFAGLTDGGANPGGRVAAGWYPTTRGVIAGRVLRAAGAAAVNFAATTWTPLTTSAQWSTTGGKAPAGGLAAFNGTWVAPYDGEYQLTAQICVGAAVNMFLAIKKNNTATDTSGTVGMNMAAGTSFFTACQVSTKVKLVAGDILRLYTFMSGAATWNSNTEQSFFDIEYVGP